MQIQLKRKPFFYDRQLKRLLVQLLACFSGYQVQTGNQRDGKTRFIDVPIIYGDHSQTVAYAAGGGSENMMPGLPIMSLYMTGLRQKAEWRQNPQHYERYEYRDIARDPDGNPIVNQPGKLKKIERYMPVPYDMDLEVSIWASNNDQGYQLVEQLCTVFNPEMDIQLSNSPADWIFLTVLIFQGEVRMEKALANFGAVENNPLYVFTLPFKTTIWMSPPVRVTDLKLIHEIHVPIKELERSLDFDSMTELDGLVIRASEQDIITAESLE